MSDDDDDDDTTGSPSAWPDLPPDLVRLVLRRLPTFADRVRLRAVCRAWRREPLPFRFPWLSLPDGTFLSVPDGKVHRFPSLLGDDDDATCRGSEGSWLFLTYGWNLCFLANPFDGAVMRLPDVTSTVIFKLVQLAPSSLGVFADSLFAVMMPGTCEISTWRPGSTGGVRTVRITPEISEILYDIAFLDGKLYAISCSRNLYIFDIDAIATSCEGKPGVPPRRCIANLEDTRRWPPRHHVVTVGDERFACKDWSYLVDSSGGRLLHVRRLIGYPWPPIGNGTAHARTLSFDVFEADMSGRVCSPWRRFAALGGGQALFVGRYSKSVVTASECGAREDCIYFVRENRWKDSAVLDPLVDSDVFDMTNGRITPLLPATVAAPPLGENLFRARPACWFFQMEVL